MSGQSKADWFASKGKLVELFDSLDDDEAAQLMFDWRFLAQG